MTWKNDTGKKIFADANDHVVEEGSPYAAVLLVDVDGTLKKADAEKYGLFVEPETKQAASGESAPADGSKAGRGPKGRFTSKKAEASASAQPVVESAPPETTQPSEQATGSSEESK